MGYIVSMQPGLYIGPDGSPVPWHKKMEFQTLEHAVVTGKMLFNDHRFHVYDLDDRFKPCALVFTNKDES